MVDENKILEKIQAIEFPKDEDPPEYRVIAHLFAGGADPSEISLMLKLDESKVQSVIELPRIQELVIDLRKKDPDIQNTIKKYLPDAVEVARKIMMDNDQKGSVRLSAVNTFLDRGLGRPTQTIEVGGSMIRQLFERLDALEVQEKAKIVNTEAKRVLEEKIDPIDAWINENL